MGQQSDQQCSDGSVEVQPIEAIALDKQGKELAHQKIPAGPGMYPCEESDQTEIEPGVTGCP